MQSFGIFAQSNQLQEKFISGDLRYECVWGCNFKFDYSRNSINEIYRNKDWIGLVNKMDEFGLNSRTTYFALFRAAEELGHYEAARVYLKLAKANSLEMGCFAINKLDMCAEMSRINSITVKEKTLANKQIREDSFKVSEISSVPVQQATVPNQEVERLKAEADDAKRKQVELANTKRIENERLLADVAEEKRRQAEAEEKLRVAQQLAFQNRENERLRAEASDAKRKQAESEEKVSITEQQIPQRNDLRSRNLAINWRLETFGGNLGNSYCQASNITYNGRDTNDGSAIFWVVVDCRTSRSGSSGGHYRFCGINHQEIMRQTGFTSVCRKN
jgi:hypothetical protein